MSNEISEAAWKRAALSRLMAVFCLSGTDTDSSSKVYNILGLDEYHEVEVTQDEALDAQAELDAADEVTHADILAFIEAIHEGEYSPSEYECKYIRLGLQAFLAARKARQA